MLPFRATHALFSSRILVSARITPIFPSRPVRNFSKITTKDRGGPRKSNVSKLHDKVFGKIANEGKKLAELDFLDGSYDFFDRPKEIPGGSGKKLFTNESFMDDFIDHHDITSGSYNGNGEIARSKKQIMDDTTPSSLFVPAPDPSEQKISKLSLYEQHMEFSLDYLNSLLYNNPFKEMKADSYDLKYPIDNQDGQEAEKGVSFKEHVLLDDLFEGFPRTGPVRNFIELVITGLSQNPFLTPEEKREHVAWFREEVDTLTPDNIKKMDTYYEQIILKKARRRRKTLVS